MAPNTQPPAVLEQLLEEMEATPGPQRRICLDVDAVLSVRMKRQARAEERSLAALTEELWRKYLRSYAKE